ncbi:hypothetical protein AB837_00525 [bacterium AB1]|nr:hypothetical protein AB837_00525 [bacterium AB1]
MPLTKKEKEQSKSQTSENVLQLQKIKQCEIDTSNVGITLEEPLEQITKQEERYIYKKEETKYEHGRFVEALCLLSENEEHMFTIKVRNTYKVKPYRQKKVKKLNFLLTIYDAQIENYESLLKIQFSYQMLEKTCLDDHRHMLKVCSYGRQSFIKHISLIMFDFNLKKIKKMEAFRLIYEQMLLFSYDLITPEFIKFIDRIFNMLHDLILKSCHLTNQKRGSKSRHNIVRGAYDLIMKHIKTNYQKQWENFGHFEVFLLINGSKTMKEHLDKIKQTKTIK